MGNMSKGCLESLKDNMGFYGTNKPANNTGIDQTVMHGNENITMI